MRLSRLVLTASMAAAFVLTIAPSEAFDQASLTRSGAADIVTDANAYTDITTSTCTIVSASGGTCTFATITNKGTTALTYSVSKTTDTGSPSAYVTNWRVGGGTSVTSNPAVTPGEIEVGGTATIRGTVRICIGCPDQTIVWSVEGDKANTLNSIQTRIATTLRYI